MQQLITGRVYVLGDNIDTDQIIPAKYLTYNPAIPEEYRMVRRADAALSRGGRARPRAGRTGHERRRRGHVAQPVDRHDAHA